MNVQLVICWEINGEFSWDEIEVKIEGSSVASVTEAADLAVEQHPYLSIPVIKHVFCVGTRRLEPFYG